MKTRPAIIAVIVLSLICLFTLVLLGGRWVRSLRDVTEEGRSMMEVYEETREEIAGLPDEGYYEVGISGSTTDGNVTQTRGMMLAVGASGGSDAETKALANSLAWLGDDYLMGISGLPHNLCMNEAPSYYSTVKLADLSEEERRQRRLNAAISLGYDAHLGVKVTGADGGFTTSFALTDMRDQSEVWTQSLSADAEGMMRGLGGVISEALEAASVELTETDRAFLADTPFTVDEYLRTGVISSGHKSREAMDALRDFLAEQPDSGMAQWLERTHLWEDWSTERRLARMEKWAATFGEQCPNVLILAAEFFGDRHDMVTVNALLAKYEAIKPNSLQADLVRGRWQILVGPWETAEAYAREAIEANPLSALVWYEFGYIHMQHAYHARGGQYLSTRTAEQRQEFVAGSTIGHECLEHALALAPDSFYLMSKVASARKENGDSTGCLELIEKMITLRPGYYAPYSEAWWLYDDGYNDEPAKQQAMLDRAATLEPESVGDEVELAGFLRNYLSAEAAEPHYERALEMAPEYFPLGYERIARGMTQMHYKGDDAIARREKALDIAEECARKSLEQYPQYGAREALADLHMIRRRYAEAEPLLRAVIEARPTDESALVSLGKTLRAQEKWPEAEAVSRASVKSRFAEKTSEFWTQAYQAMALDGRGDEALAEYQAAQDRSARWVRAQDEFGVGCAYLAMLKVDKAQEVFEGLTGEWGGGAGRRTTSDCA